MSYPRIVDELAYPVMPMVVLADDHELAAGGEFTRAAPDMRDGGTGGRRTPRGLANRDVYSGLERTEHPVRLDPHAGSHVKGCHSAREVELRLVVQSDVCLLYTSDAADDLLCV